MVFLEDLVVTCDKRVSNDYRSGMANLFIISSRLNF